MAMILEIEADNYIRVHLKCYTRRTFLWTIIHHVRKKNKDPKSARSEKNTGS